MAESLPTNDTIEAVKADFEALFKTQFSNPDEQVKAALKDAARYAAERSAHLATIAGTDEFAEAAKAEAINVGLNSAIATVEVTDEVHRKLIGSIQGGILFAARLLAIAAL